MPDDVSTVTRIASLIATSPPGVRNDSFRGICRWVNTTLSIGLVAVIMLALLLATLLNSDCLMMPLAPFLRNCLPEGKNSLRYIDRVRFRPTPGARAGVACSFPHHITQPQGFQQVGTRRRLPRPAQVDKLPVDFAANSRGSSLIRKMP